jgi:pentose-5-phosphate-3-epimerase
VRRIKASLMTVGPGFSATRMLDDYLERYTTVLAAQG